MTTPSNSETQPALGADQARPPMEEEKPMTEEEEFALRLEEDQKADVARDKEIRYQLYKLQNTLGLNGQDLNKWKDDFKLGVELVWVVRKPFIYRNLSLGEYIKLAEESQDLATLRRKIAARVILWPRVATESDFLRMPAGISQTVTESCLRTSGFEEVAALPI